MDDSIVAIYFLIFLQEKREEVSFRVSFYKIVVYTSTNNKMRYIKFTEFLKGHINIMHIINCSLRNIVEIFAFFILLSVILVKIRTTLGTGLISVPLILMFER